MTTQTSQPQPEPVNNDIVANPDTSWSSYRARRFTMVLMLLAYGAWSIYDGFINYPNENAAAIAKGLSIVPHPGLDIPFNRALGLLLPPVALALLLYTFYKSKGQYRLTTAGILHAPGHPPVPVSAVIDIDRDRWDRKGIAALVYELPNGTKGSIVLDDFIYERDPIDAIFKVVYEQLPIPDEQLPGVAPEELRPKALRPGQVSQRNKLIEKKKKPSWK